MTDSMPLFIKRGEKYYEIISCEINMISVSLIIFEPLNNKCKENVEKLLAEAYHKSDWFKIVSIY